MSHRLPMSPFPLGALNKAEIRAKPSSASHGGAFLGCVRVPVSITVCVRSLPSSCEEAVLEHDMSFLSFAEIVAVWDAVSDYILEQMKLDKVGWYAGGPCPGERFSPAKSVGLTEQSLPEHHTEQHSEPKPGAQSSLLANWEGNPRPELP